jgi:phytoene synthase
MSPLEIARASGSNFLVSFVFLSPGRRRGMLAVYAYCRVVDDVVDDAELETAEGRAAAEAQLRFWEDELGAAFAGRPGTPLGYALHRAAMRFGIDEEPLRAVVDGVRSDMRPPCYESWDELRGYMSKVASAVGLACLPVFGAHKSRCHDYAVQLGHALQYTNILRDVAEDGAQGRCYVPRAALREHGLGPADLLAGAELDRGRDSPLARFYAAECARTRDLFSRVDGLLAELPGADRRALRPARMMDRIYRELLDRVETLGAELPRRPRVRVSKLRKLGLALSAMF